MKKLLRRISTVVCFITLSFSIFPMQAKAEETKKQVYLTFDDGPTKKNTLKIIDTLNKYNVKATFFVIGKQVEQYPYIVKELQRNGMCIAPHTYAHDYGMYRNSSLYFKDLEMCQKAIKNVTEKEAPKYIRFPGGSQNQLASKSVLKNIKEQLIKEGYSYVDWNVVSGDANKRTVSSSVIKNNIIKGSKDKDIIIVLMHDSYYKTTTAEILPQVIEFYKNNGYEFKTFSNVSSEEQSDMEKLRLINRGCPRCTENIH